MAVRPANSGDEAALFVTRLTRIQPMTGVDGAGGR